MLHVMNPYKKGAPKPPLYQNLQQQQQQQAPTTMGIQSQRRQGSIASARRHGTKTKHVLQSAVNGGVAFAPHLHCPVCKARHLKARGVTVNEPHRPHHKKCPRNRKTRGLSERTVQVERICNNNIRRNNTLYYPTDIPILSHAQTAALRSNYFIPRHQPTNSHTSASTGVPPITNTQAIMPPTSVDTGTAIRTALDELIEKNTHQADLHMPNGKYPAELTLAICWVIKQFTHLKFSDTSKPLGAHFGYNTGRSKYRQFFQPGSCTFTFPQEEFGHTRITPSPHYHNIVGESFIYLDWKLMDPTVDLTCYVCANHGVTSHLHHGRTNLSKNKSFFPVWGKSGRPILSVVMIYRCECCKSVIWGNDGRLLAQLPTHLSSIYPVKPVYATGAFHLHNDITEEFDNLMITYANGTKLSNMMYRRLGMSYEKKVSTYLSQNPSKDFATFHDFIQGVFPPSGKTLRDIFQHSQHSELTYYGYSAFQRYEREIQSVEVDKNELVAIDWTFQVIKNYVLPGAKAMFTMNKGSTKEIVHLGIVRSTAVSQISHLLVKARQVRSKFTPKALYSDITPSNLIFWMSILGSGVVVLLGMFHCMHRVVDTLDPLSLVYWEVLVDLKDCFYRYAEADFRNLRECLLQGKFGREGVRMSDEEINNLRRSKRWKQRYDTYLRKEPRDEAVTCNMLSAWVQKYKNTQDEAGRPVFGRTTEKAANEQKNKVKYAVDPPDVPVYQRIPPPRKAQHDLPTWQSMRPELLLEKAHEAMAHFGNTAMRPEIADTLLLAGVANMNVKNWWTYLVNQRRLEGREPDTPLHFAFQPPFWDHSFCSTVNRRYAALNLREPFDFVTPIKENNGEVFASKYFKEQEVRNKEFGQDKKTQLCKCGECLHFVLPAAPTPPMPTTPMPTQPIPMPTPQVPTTRMPTTTMPTTAVPTTAVPTTTMPTTPMPTPLPYGPALHAHLSPQHIQQQWPIQYMSSPHIEPFLLPYMGDACMPYPPHFCFKKREYLKIKARGQRVMGKPPHDPECPCKKRKNVRHMRQTWWTTGGIDI